MRSRATSATPRLAIPPPRTSPSVRPGPLRASPNQKANMDPGQVLLFAIGGLSNAAYLFIVAAGLSLVFGALRVINMAHGSLYMIAAFLTVVIANAMGAAVGGFWTGLLLAVVLTGLIGALIEIVVLRRVYREQHLIQLLGTYALTLIIAGAVRLTFGASYRTVKAPPA